jgi:hypothetical protein
MKLAVAMEDSTEKNPVTPGEVIPAAEWLGDMLLLMQDPTDALAAYESELNKSPNRFSGLFGAATAAEQSGDHEKAGRYFRQLINTTDSDNSNRPELAQAKSYLQLLPH